MKKLSPKQLGHYCTFCPAKSMRATYRAWGWTGEFACEQHKHKLLDVYKIHFENDRITEADEQTWSNI